MSNYIVRLQEEALDLDQRIQKLEFYLDTPEFLSLDKFQQGLMEIQLPAMKTYHSILLERLSWSVFSENSEE